MPIRPDEVLMMAGGRVMRVFGVPYMQTGRIGDDDGSSFTRASAAWARVQRALWVQLSSDVARWERVEEGGGPNLRSFRLALTLESSGYNSLRFSSVLTSTAVTSTGAQVWFPSSTSGVADTISSTGSPVLQGQSGWKFTNGGGSSEHGLYQDMTTPSTRWAAMSAIVEEGNSSGFAMRLRNQGSSAVVMDGALAWDGTFTATRSTEGGASTGYPVYGQVERLGLGPNGGRAYRVTMGCRLQTPNQNLRASLFPTGVAASTKHTYMHHAQFVDEAGGRRVLVRPSTALAVKAAENMRIPQLNIPGGSMSLYHEAVLYDRPGIAGKPAVSTSPTAVFLALARGWESTDGTQRFVGGGVYNRDSQLILAGSTGAGESPGQTVEQCVSISTDGLLTYQLRVNGGPTFTAKSTGKLPPVAQRSIPSYSLSQDQQLLLSAMARGVHTLEEFRDLLP